MDPAATTAATNGKLLLILKKNTMKKLIPLFCACMSLCVMHAQNLSEDSESRSSIMLPSDNINFQSTKMTLGFNYTYGLPTLLNMDENADAKKISPSRLILGLDMTGKNDDGIATFFRNGNITPASSFDLKIGWRGFLASSEYSRLKSIRENTKAIEENYEQIKVNMMAYQAIIENLKHNLDNLNAANAANNFFQQKAKLFNDSIYPNIKRSGTLARTVSLFLADSSALKANNLSFLSVQLLMVHQMLNNNTSLDNTNNSLGQNNRNLRAAIAVTQDKGQYVVYFGVGRDTRSFRLLNDTTVDLSARYPKQNFDGGRLYLGINFYLPKRQLLGFQIGWQQTDNYDQLDIFEIVSTTSFTDSNRVDRQSKTFNVAAGKYGKFVQFPIMLDYLWFYDLPGKDVNAGALSVYARAVLRNNADLKIENTYTVGTAGYFFNREKSKFVGGIFLEYNWPKEIDDTRFPYQRLTFGITTTFNLGSFSYDKLFN
jgi:hypothetical protein